MITELKIGDPVYYQGLGWGAETFIFNILEKDGEKIIHANNGVKRKYEEVLNNTCDLYSSKEEINKKLSQSWKATLIP